MAARHSFRTTVFVVVCAIAVTIPLIYFGIGIATKIYSSGIEQQLSFNKELGNQTFIARGVARFFKSHAGRLPSSIEEMVKAGILPEESSYYRSPIHSSFSDSTSVSYTDTSYVFDPRGTNTPQYGHYVYRRDDKFPPRFLAENGFIGIDQDIESETK